MQDGALDSLLHARAVTSLYQPVSDLDTGAVAAFEALARGPAGPLAMPGAMFGAARSNDRLVELDWLCREQAVAGARAAGVRHPLSLFVNAEPETMLASLGDAARWRDFGDVRCYAELTERSLAADPATLLKAVDQVRAQDWGIALDDVGTHPASLALLPMLRPDVIKLDLRLLHTTPAAADDVEVARVLHAVLDAAASSGAAVVAEGIETQAHLDLARGYGVQYGQGWLLGRPGPLPDPITTPPTAIPLLPRLLDRAVTPGAFAVVASEATTRPVSLAGVQEIARQLLAQAVLQTPAAVVLVCAGRSDDLNEQHRTLLTSLADGPLTALLTADPCGLGLPQLRTGVHGPSDPAVHDLDVVVVSPGFTAALVSRASLPADRDLHDAVLTFDRSLVAAAANSLLLRVAAQPANAR